MSDFWTALLKQSQNSVSASSSVDTFLADAVETRIHGRSMQGTETKSVVALTDKELTKFASVELPVQTGTRVRIKRVLGASLTYDQLPGDGVHGTVVTVKTAAGNVNTFDDRVFVKFDDGVFGSFYPEHLKYANSSKTANSAIRLAMNLDDFMVGKTANELIHRSSKDLWAFEKGPEGYRLERLFDDNGSPLKEG